MAALMRAQGLGGHAARAGGAWPQSLQDRRPHLLTSRYAMWMGWGPELTFFYNDAYARDTLGVKHPWALGRAVARGLGGDLAARSGRASSRCCGPGEATWDEGLLLFLERSGYPEETYHTFSYSPLPTTRAASRGMLCVVTEETERVIGERRLALLRDLGDRRSPATKTEPRFCARRRARAGADRARPAVHADLPVRRRRDAARGWPAAPASPPAIPPRPPDASSWTDATALVAAGDSAREPATARSSTIWPTLRRAAGRRLGPSRRARAASCRSPSRARSGRRRPRRRRSTRSGRSTTPTAASSTWSPARSRPASPTRTPTRRSGGAPRRWPSSTAPRPRSSPTSATSSARR